MKLASFFKPGVLGDTVALLAGALLTLAFAPFNIFPLAILSPALLLALWLPVSTKRAFARGFLFGLGFFSTGVYWVYTSIHTYGDASVLLSSFITVGFIGILALFPALNGFLLNRYFPTNNNFKILCAFPALWFFLEWTRSWLFTGFPWLLLGYSQINTPLNGYAPIVSVYGIGFALALSAGLLYLLATQWQQTRLRNHCLIGFAALWLVGGILSFIPWTKNSGEPVQVSLVQGNIEQSVKWSPDQIQPTLDRYQTMTEPHWDSKIVVWPEGAIPVPLQQMESFVQDLNETAKLHNNTLITGIPVKADGEGYYNSVIATGTGEGAYFKRHLVPFGEFIPFKQFLTRLLDSLNIPMSDFIPSPYSSQQPLFAAGVHIATFICYEIAYAELVMTRKPDVGMLLTVSNDGWFGRSIAQAQHLQTAQMRALEMRRPVLFVANSGLTAVINAYGKIQSQIPPFETLVLTDKVQPKTGKTPWQFVGLDPMIVLSLLLLWIAKRPARFTFKRNPQKNAG